MMFGVHHASLQHESLGDGVSVSVTEIQLWGEPQTYTLTAKALLLLLIFTLDNNKNITL